MKGGGGFESGGDGLGVTKNKKEIKIGVVGGWVGLKGGGRGKGERNSCWMWGRWRGEEESGIFFSFFLFF